MISPDSKKTAARIHNIIQQFRPPLDAFETVLKSVHQHVDLSLQLAATSSIAANHLRTLGYYVREEVGGHGVVGVLRNGEGDTVLLRAELATLPLLETVPLKAGVDTLPLLDEENEWPYACQARMRDTDRVTEPVMHACEHGMHMACLTGAATLLCEARNEWTGSLVLVFQPEGGAQAMIDDGLYTNREVPLPDIVLGQHLADMRAGYIATQSGYSLPGKTTFEVKIYGRGALDVERDSFIEREYWVGLEEWIKRHGYIAPVFTAKNISDNLRKITRREPDTTKMAFISCGNINAGNAPITNPDYEVTMRVDIRAYSFHVSEELIWSFRRIV